MTADTTPLRGWSSSSIAGRALAVLNAASGYCSKRSRGTRWHRKLLIPIVIPRPAHLPAMPVLHVSLDV